MFRISVKGLLSRPVVDGRDNFVFVKIDKSLQSSSKYTEVFYAAEKTPDGVALYQSPNGISIKELFSATGPTSASGLHQHC